jgi:hypothetical protein
MNRFVAPLVTLIVEAPAFAADSVVIGRGISNSFLSNGACSAGSTCLDAQYVWVLTSNRSVVGPIVKGRVRAISTQHTDATQQFVTSVELFVLRPIKSVTVRHSSGAAFYILYLSPRNADGRYCLPVSPSSVGLHLDPAKVLATESSYCFDVRAL